MTDLDDELLVTIPEAARRLAIGRTYAYQLASAYLASGGRTGLPVVRIGRLLRVPVNGLRVFAHLPQADDEE